MVQCEFQCRVFQKTLYNCYDVVLRKSLHLKAYKLSIVQHLTDADKVICKEFCIQTFYRTQDERFLDSVIFNDVSTFHVSGSGAAKIHMSPWNMFMTAQRWRCFAPTAKKECTTPSSWRRPLPVSSIWTCSNSLHSTVSRRWPKRMHSLPARRSTPSLPWRSARIPQHPFPRSMDW
jgi:hypothetical protein